MNNRISASQQLDLQQEHACLKDRIMKELNNQTEQHIALKVEENLKKIKLDMVELEQQARQEFSLKFE